MSKNMITLASAVVAVLLFAGLFIAFTTGTGYRVVMVMPSAAQLPKGAPVWIDGSKAGEIEDLQEKGGKALATLALDQGPLHEGTTSRVEWKSALGERVVTLYPGPSTNAAIPDGGSFEGQSAQIEVDQVLAALDKPTRDHLQGLVQQASGTLKGDEGNVKQTLQSAGPTVEALGQVLQGVGDDGPAIRGLVTQLSQMSQVAADRQTQVRGVVNNLASFTHDTAQQQQGISDALGELPPTLDAAKQTLDKVPGTADATVPLLQDLGPATAKLGPVSKNLSPLLSDLRPTVAKLGPTLDAASSVLDRTPGLIDRGNQVVPALKDTVTGFSPAIAFLRPYAPEAAGFLTNFGQAFAPYDSQGHVWAGLLAPGSNAVNEDPVAGIPGSRTYDDLKPGQIVNQPWTDATGSGVR
jgi:phospholipid/cholesterol/gamma-HCH transport system substrate-binding protein